MIHFTCDCCGQTIDPQLETRYVVRVEVYSAIDGDVGEGDHEQDHLEEIDDLLERIDDLDSDDSDIYQQVRYDLCEECRAAFAKNPLGRLVPSKIGFSEN
ncbi:MAG: hypothetical protein AAGF31_08935 [Planctomycetota bacterium]